VAKQIPPNLHMGDKKIAQMEENAQNAKGIIFLFQRGSNLEEVIIKLITMKESCCLKGT
jgi:hypothetical protein